MMNKKLKEWFEKWHRKPVTGRCLIELKQRDKEAIKLLKEFVKCRKQFGQITQFEIELIFKEIDKIFGVRVIGGKGT